MIWEHLKIKWSLEFLNMGILGLSVYNPKEKTLLKMIFIRKKYNTVSDSDLIHSKQGAILTNLMSRNIIHFICRTKKFSSNLRHPHLCKDYHLKIFVNFKLIYFGSIVKQVHATYLNHFRARFLT